MELLFTPRFIESDIGWMNYQGIPTQRDYAFFLKFVPVGAVSEGVCNVCIRTHFFAYCMYTVD